MSWVVNDIVERVRTEMGRDYDWFEWEQFCADAGLDIMRWSNLPKPAYLLMETIVLREGMRRFEEAYWAWEESGHHLTSCGNREHWAQLSLRRARQAQRRKVRAQSAPRTGDTPPVAHARALFWPTDLRITK